MEWKVAEKSSSETIGTYFNCVLVVSLSVCLMLIVVSPYKRWNKTAAIMFTVIRENVNVSNWWEVPLLLEIDHQLETPMMTDIETRTENPETQQGHLHHQGMDPQFMCDQQMLQFTYHRISVDVAWEHVRSVLWNK